MIFKNVSRWILIIIQKILVKSIYEVGEKLESSWNKEQDLEFQKFIEFTKTNQDNEYYVEMLPACFQEGYKWCGGQINEGTLWGIANGAENFLQYDLYDKSINFLGELGNQGFKWTGGCIYKGCLYGFPRSAEEFVQVNMSNHIIEKIPLKFQYQGEHHYGGVCTVQGIVYQPPRNTDHILVTDLNSKKGYKIQLYPAWLRMKLRYCGSIIHPNGFAYFFPENNRKVIKLNLKTEEWCYIGNDISTMVFDAKVAVDGNIYGYSAYRPGILKISVQDDTCEMICTNIFPGAYGTKLGVNGKLYSIPGDGDSVWEYSPWDKALNTIYLFKENGEQKAKFAGGITSDDGDIYAVPANFIKGVLSIKTETTNDEVPVDIYDSIFEDNY